MKALLLPEDDGVSRIAMVDPCRWILDLPWLKTNPINIINDLAVLQWLLLQLQLPPPPALDTAIAMMVTIKQLPLQVPIMPI
jgi:hypothetical protein